MPPKAPGQSYREGITLMELAERFPDEESALPWFEDRFWPHDRTCGHCGSTNTREVRHKTMPYWCTDCRRYFSIKTDTLPGTRSGRSASGCSPSICT